MGSFFILRTAFYIDGFNIYGAICDLVKADHLAGLKPPHFLKWISYKSLCNWLASRPKSIVKLNGFQGLAGPLEVQAIKLYTALPIVDATIVGYERVQQKVSRHQNYIQACKAEGLEVHFGKFKRRDRMCRPCGTTSIGYEEKETDVHVAVDLVCDALQGNIDVAYVLTGDSDLGPAFDCIRSQTDVKLISVGFQPRPHSKELLAKSHGQVYVQRGSLEKNLLPATIVDPISGETIIRPSRYRP